VPERDEPTQGVPDPTDKPQAAFRWVMFEINLRERNRHVPQDEVFVAALLDACRRSERDLPAETTLYRARIMSLDWEFPDEPFEFADMGAPPPDRAPDGRVNPAGIPCFYGAFNPHTAVAELRPWRGARLSVATFDTAVPVRVVDLSRDQEGLTDPSLGILATAISWPVHRDDRLAYVGTQYIAERLKATGVQGLIYDSAVDPDGLNVALFDPERALKREGSVDLWKVANVIYETL